MPKKMSKNTLVIAIVDPGSPRLSFTSSDSSFGGVDLQKNYHLHLTMQSTNGETKDIPFSDSRVANIKEVFGKYNMDLIQLSQDKLSVDCGSFAEDEFKTKLDSIINKLKNTNYNSIEVQEYPQYLSSPRQGTLYPIRKKPTVS